MASATEAGRRMKAQSSGRRMVETNPEMMRVRTDESSARMNFCVVSVEVCARHGLAIGAGYFS